MGSHDCRTLQLKKPLRSGLRAADPDEHLAYHARLREAAQVVTNGPVSDQPEASLRGLTFYQTGCLAQSRHLAGADPAVRAGRLTVETMT